MILLLRFSEVTWEMTLIADRCPCRGQKEDYFKYFHESRSVEDKEEFKTGEVGEKCFFYCYF